MYRIVDMQPNGCVLVADGSTGHPYIEAGDFKRAKELLPGIDYSRVEELWTPQLIEARREELRAQEEMMISLFV